MDFEKFLKAAKNPELVKRTVSGFNERQKKREEEFKKQAKSLEPSDKWYERSYDI